MKTPDKLIFSHLENEKRQAILKCIEMLDCGEFRIAQKQEGRWIVNEWLKKAVLLNFRIQNMTIMQAGDLKFYDKIPLKQWSGSEGVRVVPHAIVRQGAFVNRVLF